MATDPKLNCTPDDKAKEAKADRNKELSVEEKVAKLQEMGLTAVRRDMGGFVRGVVCIYDLKNPVHVRTVQKLFEAGWTKDVMFRGTIKYEQYK